MTFDFAYSSPYSARGGAIISLHCQKISEQNIRLTSDQSVNLNFSIVFPLRKKTQHYIFLRLVVEVFVFRTPFFQKAYFLQQKSELLNIYLHCFILCCQEWKGPPSWLCFIKIVKMCRTSSQVAFSCFALR